MDAWKKRWGFEQWAAYFETKKLPVMGKSKAMLLSLEQAEGEQLSPHDLVSIVLNDPLLCLCLLREAERVRTHRLGNETTTPLAAIMQLGLDEFRELLFSSEEIDTTNSGLLTVESRSSTAARIALHWGSARSDLNPSEVALAALLADTGELLLWLYAPELAQAAIDELHSGRARRSSQAQSQACGFVFKELTIRCAEIWNLPALLCQLLRGAESGRAKLTRLCSNVARHLANTDDNADQAIAADLVEAHKLITGVSVEWLVGDLGDIPEARKLQLIERTKAMHTFEI